MKFLPTVKATDDLPLLIYKAAKAQLISPGQYVRNAVCEALDRDLELEPGELRSRQPEPDRVRVLAELEDVDWEVG